MTSTKYAACYPQSYLTVPPYLNKSVTPSGPKPPPAPSSQSMASHGSSRSLEETHRKSSSLPAYARQGLSKLGFKQAFGSNNNENGSANQKTLRKESGRSFGLFRRKKEEINKNESPTSSSSELEEPTIIPSRRGDSLVSGDDRSRPSPPPADNLRKCKEKELLILKGQLERSSSPPADASRKCLDGNKGRSDDSNYQNGVNSGRIARRDSYQRRRDSSVPCRRLDDDAQSTLSKKERREMLKARVEALRERLRDSSSDEESKKKKKVANRLQKFYSDESLHKAANREGRSRAARTERFYKRRSRDEESLRRELESSGVEFSAQETTPLQRSDRVELHSSLGHQSQSSSQPLPIPVSVASRTWNASNAYTTDKGDVVQSSNQSPTPQQQQILHESSSQSSQLSANEALLVTMDANHNLFPHCSAEQLNNHSPQSSSSSGPRYDCFPRRNLSLDRLPMTRREMSQERTFHSRPVTNSSDGPSRAIARDPIPDRYTHVWTKVDYPANGKMEIPTQVERYPKISSAVVNGYSEKPSHPFGQNYLLNKSSQVEMKVAMFGGHTRAPTPPPRSPKIPTTNTDPAAGHFLTSSPRQPQRPASYSFESLYANHPSYTAKPLDRTQSWGQSDSEPLEHLYRSNLPKTTSHAYNQSESLPNQTGYKPAPTQRAVSMSTVYSYTDQPPSAVRSMATSRQPSPCVYTYTDQPPKTWTNSQDYASDPNTAPLQRASGTNAVHRSASDIHSAVNEETNPLPSPRNFNSVPKPWNPQVLQVKSNGPRSPPPKVAPAFKGDRWPPENAYLSDTVACRGDYQSDSRHLRQGKHRPPPLNLKPDSSYIAHNNAVSPSPARTTMSGLSYVTEPPKSETHSNTFPLTQGKAESYNQKVGSPEIKTNAPPPPPRRYSHQFSGFTVDALETAKMDLKPVDTQNNNTQKSKSPSNLEDALLELEQIYQSLQMKEETSLNDTNESDFPESRPLVNGYPEIRSNKDSLDFENPEEYSNLQALSKLNVSGSYDSLLTDLHRRRYGPRRMSGTGPKLTDDLAYRRLQKPEPVKRNPTPTTSYLLLSPALSPATSTDDVNKARSYGTAKEPDTVFDDMSFRTIRDANSQKTLDPQPPFGIPIGPIVPAASTDYLHTAESQAKPRPMFQPRFIPDVVQDDMAFRNLRKDKSEARPSSEYSSSEVNTEELDNILKAEEKPPASSQARKKYRAVRSLSANISHLVKWNGSPAMPPPDFERAQSLTNLSDNLSDILTSIVNGPDVTPTSEVSTVSSSSNTVTTTTAAVTTTPPTDSKTTKTQTPRTVKHRHEFKRQNKTQGAASESEIGSVSHLPWMRNNLYNLRHNDTSTSTETLTESKTNLAVSASSENLHGSNAQLNDGTKKDDKPCDMWQVRVTVGTSNVDRVPTNTIKQTVIACKSDSRATSEDEAVPSWKKGSLSLSSSSLATKGLDQHQVYRPLQNLRPVKPRPFFGSVGQGSVSDSDVRSKGKPIDETRLDELLRSLAQGAMTVTPSSLRRSLTELQKKQAGDGKTDSLPKPKSSKATPTTGPPTPTTSTTTVTSSVATSTTITTTSTANNPAVAAAAKTVIAAILKAPDYELHKTQEINADPPSQTESEQDEGRRVVQTRVETVPSSVSLRYKTASATTSQNTIRSLRSPEKGNVQPPNHGKARGSQNGPESSSKNSSSLTMSESYRNKTTSNPTVSSSSREFKTSKNSSQKTASASDHKESSDDALNQESSEKKAERMAKYKEERRRQLASKYGDWSSSEDITSLGEEPSYMRFSRRYKKGSKEKDGDTGTNEAFEKLVAETLSSSSERTQQNGFCDRNTHELTKSNSINKNYLGRNTSSQEDQVLNRVPDPGGSEIFSGMVRTTRASRLRAEANMRENGTTSTSEISKSYSFRQKLSSTADSENTPRSPLYRQNATVSSSSAAELNDNALNKYTSQTPVSSDVPSSNAIESPLHIGSESSESNEPPRKIKDKSNKRKSNLNRAMIVEEIQQIGDSTEDSSHRSRRSKRAEGPTTASNTSERRAGTPSSEPLRSTEIVRSVQQKLAAWDLQATTEPSLNVSGSLDHSNDSSLSEPEDKEVSSKKPKGVALKRPEIPEVLRHRQVTASPTLSLNSSQRSTSLSEQGSNSVSVKSSERFGNLKHSESSSIGPSNRLSRSNSEKISIDLTGSNTRSSGITKIDVRKPEKTKLHNGFSKSNDVGLKSVEPSAFTVRIEVKNSECKSLEALVPSNTTQDNSRSRISKPENISDSLTNAALISDSSSSDIEMGAKADKQCSVEVEGSKKDVPSERGKHSPTRILISSSPIPPISREALEKSVPASKTHGPNRIEMYHRDRLSPAKAVVARHDTSGSSDKSDSETKESEMGNGGFKGSTKVYVKSEQIPKPMTNPSEREIKRTAVSKSFQKTNKKEPIPDRLKRNECSVQRQQSPDKRSSSEKSSKSSGSKTDSSPTRESHWRQNRDSPSKVKIDTKVSERHQNGTISQTDKHSKETLSSSKSNLYKRVEKEKSPEKGHIIKSEPKKEQLLKKTIPSHSRLVNQFGSPKREFSPSPSPPSKNHSVECESVERKSLSPDEESTEQSEESKSSDSDLVTAPEDSPATNVEFSSCANGGSTVIVIGESPLHTARSSDDSDVSFVPADEGNLSWKTSELSSILKKRTSLDEPQRQSKSPERHSLSRSSDSEQEYKSRSCEQFSILRKKSSSEESDDRSRSSETHSILKNRSIEERSLSPEPHSILKQRSSIEDLDLLSEPKPILKKKSSSEDLDFSDPKPILKKKSSTDDEEKPRPILKTRQKSGEDFDSGSDSSTSRRFRSLSRELENYDVDIRPILRSRMSLDEESSKPVSILKSSGSEDCSSKPQSILKSRSTTELEERVVPILKSRKDESEEKTFASILRTRSESEGEEGSSSSTPVTTPVRPTSLLLPSELEEKAESKSSLSSSASLSPLLPSILKKKAKEVHPLATPHTELAGILRAQRKLESPEDEEENRRITPIDIPDEGEDGPRISVAERIFQMETKLEDERNRSCPSPWRSGQSTPRGFRSTAGSTPPFRSGECTPRLDEKIAQLMQCYKPISDEQLLSRLEDVAQSSKQKRRNRMSDRYRTQPVTSEELEETDSLASVQSFRRMVLTRASLDAFKQREKELSPRSPTDKKTEFPQPFRPEHRKDRNKLRYRTLPITQEELNEAEKMSSVRAAATQRKTSEADSSTATQDEDEDKESDDEILHLSVAAKASLFMHMQAKKAATQPPTVRRYINRRGLQRSQTQPITVEELHEASKVADEESNGTSPGAQPESKPIKKQNSVSNISNLGTMSETEKKNKSSSESDDDFTKMSLAERVKFFNLKVQEDKLPSQKPPLSGAPMRKRRFKTQPVTTEEVEKAQALKVSPLAASLTKPPEPEILSTLPIQAARDLIYKHGEEMLTKTSSRQSSAATSPTQEQPSVNSGLVIKSASIKKVTESKEEQRIRSESCPQPSTTSTNCVAETTSNVTKKAVTTRQQEIQHKASVTKTVESESKTVKMSSSEIQVETSSETCVRSTTVGVYSSNDDDSSSTSSGREMKRIKNEAVNRRRNAALRKMEERRSCCELVGAETAAASGARMQAMLHAHHQRSNTEPLTKLEKEEAKEQADEVRGGTVAERLAALQKSGEEEWRKRVPLFKDNDIPILKPNKEKEETPESKARERRRSRDERPSSIVDRINLLETAQQSWKQRVEEKDTSKFTVAGKMGRSPKVSQESPLTDRQKRTPKAAIFRSKTADLRELQQKADISTPVKIGSPLVHRSISMPNNDIDSLASLTDSEEENNSPIKVAVPKADDETFQAFFESVNSEKLSSQKVEINEDVFEQIVSESRQMLKIQKRTVKKQGRKVGSRNPLKTLAERADIQNEYTEVKSGFAEKEFKRIKVEQFAKNSDLAISALAGLASKEDFTAIALKKSTIAINSPLLPYKDLMLIQVKGRRHVQSRLVEPTVKSINKGDNYILVTPSEVYCWIGEFSNVIERSRAAEISAMIQTKRDLGCKSLSEVIIIDDEKKTARSQAKKFFSLLGGEEQSKEAANPEEDELYESAIIDTNMIYKVENEELIPFEEYWGNIPKYEMLNSKQVLVFDFGSEMYVWQGKQAPFDLRKKAIHLAKELWEQGYDYSGCDISPIHNLLNDPSVPKEGKQRPAWTLFAKMNQHMETVLFREKFLDWPDMSRVIKVKRQESDEKVDTTTELTPCDPKEMLEQEVKEPDLILEGSHVGRGIAFWDEAENRNYEITTLGIKVWHILEYDRYMLPRESWGQFHSGDTYVIRWQFMVTVAGRDLSGQISRHSFVGRERCAYFFWQGKDSTINEKGASALMTVELDEERGPHVRVSQGSEPPSFLNLFDGTMIIYSGKREVEADKKEEADKTKSSWLMFMVRGEFENEAFLVEIKRSKGALRSRGSYILINTKTGVVFVWHGSKTQTHTREIANFTAENMKQSRPMELGVSNGTQLEIKVIQEGKETKEFLAGLGDDKQSYHSLLKSSLTFDYTPRLYNLSSVSGIFMATEILCPFRSVKLVCSFPFLQSELYKTQQPALFLLDNHHEVFLWQGWWPEADDDNDNTATGSAKIRWNVDRRCAMQTAMLYCKEKNPESPPPAYLVSAGLEPLSFTNLFPEWELHEEITAQNLKEGKNIGEQLMVEEVLSHLTRTRYSLDELQVDPLPEGVDPSRLESYLADDEFQDVLKMTKEEFYSLPEWKQTNMKKSAELF